jgi:hypothetical protein
MTSTVRLIAAALAGCAGVWLLVSGLAQRRPALAKMAGYLHREPSAAPVAARGWSRFGRPVLKAVRLPRPVLADLRLVQRPPEVHAAYLAAAAAGGFFGPSLMLAAVQAFELASIGLVVPLGLVLVSAIASPLLVQSTMRQRAADVRRDLRYQLSAYLDVVTMLLAGNVGNEGSLRQAAQAGDGRLFVELRRRILVAETSNRSLVWALGRLGEDLELVELQQIAASASLGTGSGAPVARSLAAKCATLRSTLASEQEADARVRTGKITLPLVGMSLLIMAAVVYPALNFTR